MVMCKSLAMLPLAVPCFAPTLLPPPSSLCCDAAVGAHAAEEALHLA